MATLLDKATRCLLPDREVSDGKTATDRGRARRDISQPRDMP